MKKILIVLSILVQVSVVYSQHFIKGYISSSPSDPMAIKVKSAIIEGVAAQPGDEIAVFDGNLCCGVLVLTGVLDPNNSATWEILNASADDGVDGLGNPLLNGFTSGNTIYYRFWDSSENKEYHNVVATYHNTSNGVISPQPFATNGGAFVLLSTASTPKTWTDNSTQSWSDPDAWDPIGVPEPFHDVVIPLGTSVPSLSASVKAICGSLTINNNLNILSTASGTGSLIVGGISGSGVVSSRRYMTGGAWHLISSQVSGQTISSFLTANSAIPTATVGSSRGMMDYDEASDKWSSFFTTSTLGNLTSGKGFGIRTSSNTFVTHTGSLINNSVNVGVTDSKFGWNLIGNPYTSAIYTRQEVFGFLTVNAGALDQSYTAIYLWDQGANAYTIINNGQGESMLASGQGFFIKAASAGSVNFTQAMQVHKTDAPFKSAVIDAPTVVLKAKAGELYSTTKIGFNEEMTLGLDPSYDAGILRSGNGFDIYSKLVNDNGVDFAIQWLPGKSNDSYVIPVGVDATKVGEIVFSAQSLNLPVGYGVVIEDKLTKTQTDIKNGELYVAEITANSKGTGRFYLHVGSSLQTGINEIQKDELVVYSIDNTVYIKGDVGNNARFAVYSIDGRLINRFEAVSQNLNQISTAGYTPGVYFLSVQGNVKYKPVKFVVEN